LVGNVRFELTTLGL